MGPRVTRGGRPIARPKGSKTPCYMCPKIPPGEDPVPANACELTDQDWQTVQHFRECRAVGRFPDDPRVRLHASILSAAEDFADRVAAVRSGASALTRLFSG